MAIGASVALTTPAAGAATHGQHRTRPPRAEVGASGLKAFTTPDSPWVVTAIYCGNHKAVKTSYSQYFTLYAYGGDGGDNAYDKHGGGGSVAAGAYRMPVGTTLNAVAGCQGESASTTHHRTTIGGDSPTLGRGGNGGKGSANGRSGGAGGGMSGWYRGIEPLVEGSGGGGAGGFNKTVWQGGEGGDGDNYGNLSGQAGHGWPGKWDQAGYGGGPDGSNGGTHSGGAGGPWKGIGGGGGGAGYRGGGGGGGGISNTNPSEPGGGGGGGGSTINTETGYVADFGGWGHGQKLDGIATMIRVRAITRKATYASDIVRGVTGNGVKGGGFVVDGTGVIRTFSQGVEPGAPHPTATWPGVDIARGIATLPDGTGGYVVDLYGVLHPFTIGNSPPPPAVTTRAIWPGQDMARGIAILPDGTGGYVVGRNGARIPFAIGSNPKPPGNTGGPSWPGMDRARGITVAYLDSQGRPGGYIVDANGTLVGWGQFLGSPIFPGLSPALAARGIVAFPGGDGGLLVDGRGNLFPYATPGTP
jgi:hypothetical protein